MRVEVQQTRHPVDEDTAEAVVPCCSSSIQQQQRLQQAHLCIVLDHSG